MDTEARLELASVIDELSAEDRGFIAGISENDVIRLHHGLGTGIRNRFRAGSLPALLRWSCSQAPDPQHLDDMSWPILMEIWRTLRARAEPQ